MQSPVRLRFNRIGGRGYLLHLGWPRRGMVVLGLHHDRTLGRREEWDGLELTIYPPGEHLPMRGPSCYWRTPSVRGRGVFCLLKLYPAMFLLMAGIYRDSYWAPRSER